MNTGMVNTSEMLTHVEFRSDRFPPYDGEEELVNPGLWGKRLAEFLRESLPAKGIKTGEPVAEDWGWVLPVINDKFDMWIGCGNYQEYPDGFLCFIEPHTPIIRKFLKEINTRQEVESLQRALDNILAESAGIRSKRWWPHTDFNNPSR
jgi:hypothetical protein